MNCLLLMQCLNVINFIFRFFLLFLWSFLLFHLSFYLILNIYGSAEQWWYLIVNEDSLRNEYLKVMEDSLIEQIRKYGSYRNYLENVKPEETCILI